MREVFSYIATCGSITIGVMIHDDGEVIFADDGKPVPDGTYTVTYGEHKENLGTLEVKDGAFVPGSVRPSEPLSGTELVLSLFRAAGPVEFVGLSELLSDD